MLPCHINFPEESATTFRGIAVRDSSRALQLYCLLKIHVLQKPFQNSVSFATLLIPLRHSKISAAHNERILYTHDETSAEISSTHAGAY